jgi:hypothetical protein
MFGGLTHENKMRTLGPGSQAAKAHGAMTKPEIVGVLIAGFLSLGIASPQAETFIMGFRTPEAAIIAADSKVSTAKGLDAGYACKIHIANELVWAAAGILQELRGPFNFWTIVETAISSGGSLDDIASRFEKDAIYQFKGLLVRVKRDHPDEYKEAVKNTYIATIVFIQKSSLIMRIRYLVVPDEAAPESIQIVRHDCPGDACPAGSGEFRMGEHQAVDVELQRYSDVWQEKGFVGTLNYLVDVQHAATPWLVAPPVSILRIDKSGVLTWLQNGECN